MKHPLFLLLSLLLLIAACKKPKPSEPSPFHATDTLGKRLEVVSDRYSRMLDSAGRPLMDWRLVGVQDDRCLTELCIFCRDTYGTAMFEVIHHSKQDTLKSLGLIIRGCITNSNGFIYVDTISYRFRLADMFPWPDSINTTINLPQLTDYKTYVRAQSLCGIYPDSCTALQ